MRNLPLHETIKEAKRMDTRSFSIDGSGDRADELAERFLQHISERAEPTIRLSRGPLGEDTGESSTDSPEYYWVEQDLGEDALAAMAVRIASSESDLMVEWQHWTAPPMGMVPVIPDIVLWTYDRDPGRPPLTLRALPLGCGFFGLVIIGIGLFFGGLKGLMEVWPAVLLAVAGLGLYFWRSPGRRDALPSDQANASAALQLAVREALKEAIDDMGFAPAQAASL